MTDAVRKEPIEAPPPQGLLLSPEGIARFQSLRQDAMDAVTRRFYEEYPALYEGSGPRGRELCREDLGFHLEFLRPVLEFGLLKPMVDYVRWLGSVLEARALPSSHVPISLDWLGEFFADRMEPDEGTVVKGALAAARQGFLQEGPMPIAPAVSALAADAAEMEAALLCGNHVAATGILRRLMAGGMGLVEIEGSVLQPVLYRIGARWQANEVTVAQEHMATAMVHALMTLGLMEGPAPAPVGRKVLVACVEGNQHAVGARMVADAFQLGGWEVQYLGANVPLRALVDQVALWRPDLVGLSVSFAQQLRAAREAIALAGERLGPGRPAFLIGGLAINRFPALAGAVSADAHAADATEALRWARSSALTGPGA